MQPLPAPLLGAVNHLLGRSPWARERLAPFAGRAATIALPPFAAAFLIEAGGGLAAPPAGATADVAISLPAATPLLALQGREAVLRAARIEGPAEFAQALDFVLRHLEWDAEEDVSQVLGNIAAHRIVAGADEFAAWQRQAAQNLAENLVEYVTEEQPLVARREDVAAFCAGVAGLREDLARLEDRLERLR